MNYLTRVQPGDTVKLTDLDPNETAGLKKEEGEKKLDELTDELRDLQELLYAAGTHALLIVLQAMDTGGKDGAIRNVFSGINPLGCHVQAFKAPTEEELAHDFLWRIHPHAPPRGMISVFNRSHYEDVLIVRVRNLTPREVWEKRYEHINNFEKLIADNHTLILKFFLHISKEEQEERLLAREKDATKAWKLNPGDWEERKLWDDYQHAYEDALTRCSTPHAPWHIVPANKKWFRNIAVAHTIVEALRPLKDDWMQHLESESKARLAELQAYRAAGGGTK